MYSPSEAAEGHAFGPIPAWPRHAPEAEPLWRRSDAAGLAIDFNATWLRFTDRSPQSSARNGWLQDVHPDDRARCLAIHAAMHDQRLPYTLDFRLRHTVRGHRWVMERATPLFGPDGRFDGFAHHCTDIDDRMLLEEDLAARSRRLRCAMRTQALFATALAAELDRLPPAQVRGALRVMARLAAQAPAVRRVATPAGEWLQGIARELAQCGDATVRPAEIAPAAEAAILWIDPGLLAPALACALACAAALRGSRGAGSRAEAGWRADAVDGALVIALPALPGSSGFVLLDLALRLHGCVLESVASDAMRWRVALPLA
jgi:hypothetical protein